MNVESHEGDILGRARDGDERAFLALFRAAQPGLLRYLAVIAGSAAEEIATQTWVEIGRDLPVFCGGLDDFRAWVATVGRRRAVDHVERLRSVERLPRQGAAEQNPFAAAPPRTAHALRLVAELEPDQAEAVLLRSALGLDESAAASVLGMQRSALRRAAVRGLRALGRRLESMPRAERAGRVADQAPTLRVVTLPLDPVSASRVPDRRVDLSRDLTPSHGIEVIS